MERVVILDNIRSIHNVGSVFRTADAAGFSKIYLCGVTPTPLDRFGRPEPRLAKVGLGAEKTVAWESVKSTSLLISRLKRKGFKVFAIEKAENSTSLFKKNPPAGGSKKEMIALVMGEETKGLSGAILKRCDAVLHIPMYGKKESLNVSVAFGIAAYGLDH